MELVIGTAGDRDFSIDAQQLVTGRTCIIAQSGAGKSWAIAVLCERLCAAGIGFLIVDTEGEYFSLRERYPVLWVGSDERCDEDIDRADLKGLMLRAVVNGTAVVFDVSEAEGMREKVRFVVAKMERRLQLLGYSWRDAVSTQAYTVQNIGHLVGEEIAARGACAGGLVWHYARPPVIGLEYEMDVRAAAREIVI